MAGQHFGTWLPSIWPISWRVSGLVKRLVNRLQVEDWYNRHPEIEEEVIRDPVFNVGLPRTGSTALSLTTISDHPPSPRATVQNIIAPMNSRGSQAAHSPFARGLPSQVACMKTSCWVTKLSRSHPSGT